MSWDNLIVKDITLSKQISGLADKSYFRGVAWIIARSGDSWVWFVLSAVFIWQLPQFGWFLFATVALTALLTAIAKGIFKRERPAPKWAISTDKYAFPSGHAARAGAVAVAFSAAFPPWGFLFFIWALLVCLSRVALARHFLSDVGGGLLFGILIGLILLIIF